MFVHDTRYKRSFADTLALVERPRAWFSQADENQKQIALSQKRNRGVRTPDGGCLKLR